MTNEELERIMNFIIERQERMTERQERMTEQHEQFSVEMREQQELARVLLDTQAALTESVTRLTAKDASHDERIARFERSYTAIADLLRAHDLQLGEVTTSINGTNDAVTKLVSTVAEQGTQIAAMTEGINRHDSQIAATSKRVDRNDAQIAAMTKGIDNLSRIVERYITARGTNGDKE